MIESGQFSNLSEILICDHLNFKFQEALIKIEQVTLMIKSNRGFFTDRGDVTPRLMIRSGQFWIWSALSIRIHITYKFQEHQIKKEGVM